MKSAASIISNKKEIMNRPVIFYHLWRGGEWERSTQFIFSKIVESGLADACESVNICVNDENSVDNIKLYGIPEEKVIFRSVKDTKTEWPTLLEMYETYSSIPDVPILYLHSKGASYTGTDPRREPVIDWVAGLTYYLIEEWHTCMSMMRLGAKCVGANKRKDPTPHFSGNFWWIDSSALNALPNPRFQNHDESNRFGAEFWIGSVGDVNLRNVGLVGFNYEKKIPKSVYEKKYLRSRNERNVCVAYDSNLDLKFIRDSLNHHDVYQNGYNSYASSYLEYILNNYHNIPDVNFFIRTSQLVSRFPGILDAIEKDEITQFKALSNESLTSDVNGAPHHPGLPIRNIWESTFEDCLQPDEYSFGPGAMFAVTRDEILSNSIEVYENLLENIERKKNPIQDYALERMWESIFIDKNFEIINERFDLEVCIFNYGHIDNAIKLYKQFDACGIKARILDSFKESVDKLPKVSYIEKYDNIFYSGLWNKAVDKFKGTHLMVITSDVTIDNVNHIIKNAKSFFKKEDNWIYAPNVEYTFWKYDQELLQTYKNGLKIVPNTDGMCWILNKESVDFIGDIDLKINKIGFGVDLLACMNATKLGKNVVRDYSITVKHPQSRSYNSQEAEKQEFEWIEQKGLLREYINYRNNFSMSFLG